jgi:hypothetical protein
MKEKRWLMSRNPGATFLFHMNNSMYQNGHDITCQLAAHNIPRTPHPFYSPDLNPCDFWLLDSMNGVKLYMEDHIIKVVPAIWRGITFETPQSVAKEWMRRLIWGINDNGEYHFE